MKNKVLLSLNADQLELLRLGLTQLTSGIYYDHGSGAQLYTTVCSIVDTAIELCRSRDQVAEADDRLYKLLRGLPQ